MRSGSVVAVPADGLVTPNSVLLLCPILLALAPLLVMVRPISARVAQAVRPRRAPQSHPRFRQQQRFASSAPNTEELQKKAQDTFASVQKGLGQAFETGRKFLGPVGEQAGRLLGCTWYLFTCAPDVLALSCCSMFVSAFSAVPRVYSLLSNLSNYLRSPYIA